jgi:hypothetical protein
MKTCDEIKKYCFLHGYMMAYADYAATHRTCEACGDIAALPHHINTRGAHGDIDDAWNLLGLCQRHHRMIHDISAAAFADRFPLLSD